MTDMAEQLIALQRSDEMDALREANIALAAENAALTEALKAISDVVRWEINPSNYTHEEVCDLNSDWCVVGNIVDDALRALAGDDQ